MFKRDRVAESLGFRLERDEDGVATVSVDLTQDMLNGYGMTHGGIVFTLADTAFALASNCNEFMTVAMGVDINFLKMTYAGQRLRATAVRRLQNGRNGLYDVTVTDETGDVVAEFRGRSFTLSRKFHEAPGSSRSIGDRDN